MLFFSSECMWFASVFGCDVHSSVRVIITQWFIMKQGHVENKPNVLTCYLLWIKVTIIIIKDFPFSQLLTVNVQIFIYFFQLLWWRIDSQFGQHVFDISVLHFMFVILILFKYWPVFYKKKKKAQYKMINFCLPVSLGFNQPRPLSLSLSITHTSNFPSSYNVFKSLTSGSFNSLPHNPDY